MIIINPKDRVKITNKEIGIPKPFFREYLRVSLLILKAPEILLKMIENAFYITLKILFVLDISQSLFSSLIMQENGWM